MAVTQTAVVPVVAIMEVDELDSAWFTGTLKDEEGVAVPLASLSTLTMTLYNRATDAIINNRNGVNVLNSNGGSYHATSGVFEMSFESADNPIVASTIPEGETETHDALFVATWGTTGRKSFIVRLIVKQMRHVP